jgi:IclR helix-turn-helix domain
VETQISDVSEIQNVLKREGVILEVMRNARTPMPVAEISAKSQVPLSSCYRSLTALENIGVLITTKEKIANDKGKERLTTCYSVDTKRADSFAITSPTIGDTVPGFYNLLSKKLYSMLDLMGRFDPTGPKTSGAKAADAYLVVCTQLLSLSFKDVDTDTKREQILLRQYLQQAQAVVKNIDSTIDQMLNDHRLWSDELFVVSAIEEVRASKDLIHERASRSSIND